MNKEDVMKPFFIFRSTFEQYEPSYMVCPSCKSSMNLYQKHCGNCGQRVETERERKEQNKQLKE